ncbi:MAG: RDD family protein [Anaerolineae bacterium]
MSTATNDRIVIETPENIAFGYDVAGLGSRFVAAFIDNLILGILYTILGIAFTLLSFTSVLTRLPSDLTSILPALVLLVMFLLWFGYYIVFEIFMGGQSPGKRLLNLRVIKENGYPLGVVDCIIRNLVRVVDFIPFGYGVGVIVMFLNDRSKRLGDFAAGTLVVNVHESVKLADLQAASARIAASPPTAPAPAPLEADPYAPASAPAPDPVPDISGLGSLRPSDIDLIESYLLRRPKLANADALGAQLAAQVRARLAGDGALDAEAEKTANERPEVFMQQVVTAYRATHTRR